MPLYLFGLAVLCFAIERIFPGWACQKCERGRFVLFAIRLGLVNGNNAHSQSLANPY